MTEDLKEFALSLGISDLESIPKRLYDLIEEVSKKRGNAFDRMKAVSCIKEAAGWFPKEFKGYPPCQEVVMAKPDVSSFSQMKHVTVTINNIVSEAGEYPSSGGEQIVETLPIKFSSSDKVEIRWPACSKIKAIFDKSVDNQFDMAMTKGSSLYDMLSEINLPFNISPWVAAGFLLNKGIEMADCITENLSVPADCDFVIGGYIDRNEFKKSGQEYPLMTVTGFSHKKFAEKLFYTPESEMGIKERTLKNLLEERLLLPILQLTVAPEIEDIAFADYGLCKNVVIVKIGNSGKAIPVGYRGQVLKVAHAIWGSPMLMLSKVLVFVSDVDIHDSEALDNAILKNYIPKGDTYFTRGPIDEDDKSSPQKGFGGKMCIDATGFAYACVERSASGKQKLLSFFKQGEDVPNDALISVMVKEELNKEALTLIALHYDAIMNVYIVGEGEKSALVIKA